MKRLGIALLCAVGGYLVSAFVGYYLTDFLSPNTHDRTVEAAMTSAFVWGPIGAVAAFVVGSMRSGRNSGNTTSLK